MPTIVPMTMSFGNYCALFLIPGWREIMGMPVAERKQALRSSDKKVIIPPLYGALLKNEQDVHLFERVVFMARSGR